MRAFRPAAVLTAFAAGMLGAATVVAFSSTGLLPAAQSSNAASKQGTRYCFVVARERHCVILPRGPEGAQGKTGDGGKTGERGPEGARGLTGAIGLTGPIGPAGEIGPAGLKGDTGPKGEPGPIGPDGAKGATGAQGPAGPDGMRGPAGADGAQGQPGADGQDGAPGQQGQQGIQGVQGPAGPDPSVAYVTYFGVVDAAASKNITAANISNPANGVYCFHNLGFSFRTALVSFDNGGTAVQAFAVDKIMSIYSENGNTFSTATPCGPDTQAVVTAYDVGANALVNSNFVLWFTK